MGKSKGKITNRKQYNQALVNRGAITFWIDQEAITKWYCTTPSGRRGRSNTYSDTAIETALILKGIFGLPLRALEGFINSIFERMDVELQSPDYTCISKRSQTVGVDYRQPGKGPIEHLVIDSTGLKVFGEGEWKVRKHGAEKRRVWRKIHLAVDAKTHQIVSAVVSLDNVHDSEALSTLVNPLRRQIKQISADGAYDTKRRYQIIAKKKAKVTIPPRKNAGYWEDRHLRNEAARALKNGELDNWKHEHGYHQRSISETAMYRLKQLLSDKLSLLCYNGQVHEALANVKVLNKMATLGMPALQAFN